jgi:hypothetical protein
LLPAGGAVVGAEGAKATFEGSGGCLLQGGCSISSSRSSSTCSIDSIGALLAAGEAAPVVAITRSRPAPWEASHHVAKATTALPSGGWPHGGGAAPAAAAVLAVEGAPGGPPRWRRDLATAATFLVSGIEHEVYHW